MSELFPLVVQTATITATVLATAGTIIAVGTILAQKLFP